MSFTLGTSVGRVDGAAVRGGVVVICREFLDSRNSEARVWSVDLELEVLVLKKKRSFNVKCC